MVDLASLVRSAAERWEPGVERAIFGSGDPGDVADAIVEFVTGQLTLVEEAVFYHSGVGVVAGLRLVDGSEVVVKVHRWNLNMGRLTAVQHVQAYLASLGLPAPRPLRGPQSLGRGIATIEELAAGGTVDGHDRSVRQSLAVGLHSFVRASESLAASIDVGQPMILRPADSPLWPEQHDVRFDFNATAVGAEWIDEFATQARRRLQHIDGVSVVGLFDWRVENLGFEDGRIGAIYDWDSLACAPEPVIVGNTAAQFTADWASNNPDRIPTLEEMRTFVDDYEVERGKPFSAAEREFLDAANLFLCAYGALCQHSDLALHPEIGGTPRSQWLRLLRQRGEGGLLS
jgi:hypothetical protein